MRSVRSSKGMARSGLLMVPVAVKPGLGVDHQCSGCDHLQERGWKAGEALQAYEIEFDLDFDGDGAIGDSDLPISYVVQNTYNKERTSSIYTNRDFSRSYAYSLDESGRIAFAQVDVSETKTTTYLSDFSNSTRTEEYSELYVVDYFQEGVSVIGYELNEDLSLNSVRFINSMRIEQLEGGGYTYSSEAIRFKDGVVDSDWLADKSL